MFVMTQIENSQRYSFRIFCVSQFFFPSCLQISEEDRDSYPGGRIFKKTIFNPFVFICFFRRHIPWGKFRRIPKTRKTRADSSLEQSSTNNEHSCSSYEYSSGSNIVKASTHFIFPLAGHHSVEGAEGNNCLRLVLVAVQPILWWRRLFPPAWRSPWQHHSDDGSSTCGLSLRTACVVQPSSH